MTDMATRHEETLTPTADDAPMEVWLGVLSSAMPPRHPAVVRRAGVKTYRLIQPQPPATLHHEASQEREKVRGAGLWRTAGPNDDFPFAVVLCEPPVHMSLGDSINLTISSTFLETS